MGKPPSNTHSIDRINNDLGYNKDNCRWATRTQQQRNTSRNRMLTVNGISKTLAEWSDDTGINYHTISQRIKLGWSCHHALTKPVRGAKLPPLARQGDQGCGPGGG
jgi:hypothetical protein